MKHPRGFFQYRYKGHILEVWLGTPGHPESEYILAVNYTYIPDLIATLKEAIQHRDK